MPRRKRHIRSSVVDPDDDVYVRSLRRVLADEDVIDEARRQVTPENFVPATDECRDQTGEHELSPA